MSKLRAMVTDPAKTKRNCYSDVDNRWGKRYWHKITRRAGKAFTQNEVARHESHSGPRL